MAAEFPDHTSTTFNATVQRGITFGQLYPLLSNPLLLYKE
jgi:hypothetical protein